MNLIFYLKNLFNQKKLLKENPIFKLLVFSPASIIASVLIIPFSIVSLPIALFRLSIQKPVTKILLYTQHSISLGGLYVIEEIIFDDFQYHDIILGSIFALFAFYRSIKSMVAETLEKTF